jgi:hypothetical protein
LFFGMSERTRRWTGRGRTGARRVEGRVQGLLTECQALGLELTELLAKVTLLWGGLMEEGTHFILLDAFASWLGVLQCSSLLCTIV